MRNKIVKGLLVFLGLFAIIPTVSAEMMLFVGEGCDHCERLQAQLIEEDLYSSFDIQEFEIYFNQENKNLYLQKSQEVGYSEGGVPLLINGKDYVEGTAPIIAYLEKEKTGEQDPAELSTTLSAEDSKNLTEILNSNNKVQPFIDEVGANTTTGEQEILGLIVIVFGLSLFTTMVSRARKKK